MKYWLSHLPLEVWLDVFCYPWIDRKGMGKIVDRIVNRKFAEYLQFYLHDWGKCKLNELFFDKDGLYKYVIAERIYLQDIPQTQVPANIKSFKWILIKHFDQRTIDFLHQIHPLLVDIKLNLSNIRDENLPTLRIILANLVPLLDGTHSLSCNVRALPTVQQCFGAKLANINMIRVEAFPMDAATQQAGVNFFMNWLPAPSNGPKWCYVLLDNNDHGFVERISTAICQEFLAAKDPSTFFISVCVVPRQQREFSEFHLGNNIGEELHGVHVVDGHFQRVQFTRHQANCGSELQEWARGINPRTFSMAFQNRISIQRPTIGLLDAMDAPEDVNEAQQPSTSKEA